MFEYDGEVAYFYLLDLLRPDGKKIIGAIHVVTGIVNISDDRICVKWNHQQTAVGLFIDGEVWAVFDGESRFGGEYAEGRVSNVPMGLKKTFTDGRF